MGDVTSVRGWRHKNAAAPKSVKRNILRSSAERNFLKSSGWAGKDPAKIFLPEKEV
jgi:hypothetical protein